MTITIRLKVIRNAPAGDLLAARLNYIILGMDFNDIYEVPLAKVRLFIYH